MSNRIHLGQGLPNNTHPQNTPIQAPNQTTSVVGVSNPNMIIRITKLIATPVDGDRYQTPFQNSYNLTVTHDTQDTILDTVARARSIGNKLSIASTANNLSNVMNIGVGEGAGAATIANGWQSTRLRFLMEVNTVVNGVDSLHYVQGYTETYDPSLSGHIDDNMKWEINSISTYGRMTDPISGGIIVRPTANYTVLAGDINSDLKLVRPKDIVTNIAQTISLGKGAQITNLTDHVNRVVTSDRANSSPIKHLTRTINGFLASSDNQSQHLGDIYTDAVGNLDETTLTSNEFIMGMRMVTGGMSPNIFTLHTLGLVDSNITNPASGIINISERNPNGVQAPTVDTISLDATQTEVLYKPTIESQIASMTAHTMNGALLDNKLYSLVFTATNHSGPIVVAVPNAQTMVTGLNPIPDIERVKSFIETVLLPSVTRNNTLGIIIKGSIDTIGDTTVAVSVNGNPEVVFRYPTFADNRFSPVVSDEINRSSLADNMSYLLDNVTSIIN